MRELPFPFTCHGHFYTHLKPHADLVSCSMITLIVADWLGVLTK